MSQTQYIKEKAEKFAPEIMKNNPVDTNKGWSENRLSDISAGFIAGLTEAINTNPLVGALKRIEDITLDCHTQVEVAQIMEIAREALSTVDEGKQVEGESIKEKLQYCFDIFMPKNVAADDRKQMAMYEAYHTIMNHLSKPTPAPKEDGVSMSKTDQYWKGFDAGLELLDDMFGKQHSHPYNIADCVKAKVNRLDKSKIRLAATKEDGAEAVAVLEFVRKLNPMQHIVANQSGKWCVEVDGQTMVAASDELYKLFKQKQ